MCVDENFETIAGEVKSVDPKYTWEIVGVYRATHEDIRVIERFAARTGFSQNPTKHSVIGGDLKLSQADWNENTEEISGTQAIINRLVWDNGYTQVVGSPRPDVLLYVYFVRPEISLVSCSILHGISDNCGVLLEVECGEICVRHKWKDWSPYTTQLM